MRMRVVSFRRGTNLAFTSRMNKDVAPMMRHSGLISLDTPFRNVLKKARLNVLLSCELTYQPLLPHGYWSLVIIYVSALFALFYY
jgi:hypothetical protein